MLYCDIVDVTVSFSRRLTIISIDQSDLTLLISSRRSFLFVFSTLILFIFSTSLLSRRSVWVLCRSNWQVGSILLFMRSS